MSFIDLSSDVGDRLARAQAPRVVGKLTWPGSMVLEDLRFLKRHARRPVKMTVIGPLTTACPACQRVLPRRRGSRHGCCLRNQSGTQNVATEGADILQLDEPEFHFRPDQVRSWGTRALDRALEGIHVPTIVHICYGYATVGTKHIDPNYGDALEAIAASSVTASVWSTIQRHSPEILRHCGVKTVVLGLLNLGTQTVEKPEYIAGRIRAALDILPPERLHLGPDCGMWFLPK